MIDIKRLLASIIILVFCVATVSFGATSICFIGYANSKPVRLRLTLAGDGFDKAKVRYYGQKEDIPLVFLREEELRRNQDRPSLIQAEWEEVYGDKKTGRYVMVVQGAAVYDFIYLRYKDMKIFAFERDPEEW